MQPVVEAKALVKRYHDRTVVNGLDLEIAPGQCFGLLGPNGAGKTTTLRMLLGQAQADSGTLKVFGLPIPQQARAVRARTGIVPQLDNLDPDFTVAQNLRVYGRYFGLSTATLETRIRELLAFVELADRADAQIGTLSGGMKRRLTIARALVNDPDLVVLDEPTTGVDPQARHMIWARVRELRARGKTLLLTTHYMEEAERVCDDVVIFDHGRVLERGAPAALIRRHVEPEVLELHGERTSIESATEGLEGRLDTVGDTHFFYAQDARAAIARLEAYAHSGASGVTFRRRPADLEDVFLKLTGRELRD